MGGQLDRDRYSDRRLTAGRSGPILAARIVRCTACLLARHDDDGEADDEPDALVLLEMTLFSRSPWTDMARAPDQPSHGIP